MPELPEVETLRRQLEKEVVGKRIKTLEISSAKLVSRHSTIKAFATDLEGVKLAKLKRRGAYLQFKLDNDEMLVIDLGPTGKLRKNTTKDPVEPDTIATFNFTQGGQLRLSDPKINARMFRTPFATANADIDEFATMGADVVEEPIAWIEFARAILSSNSKLKALLTDQSVFAGIGAIYSDEILYDAGLRYDRIANSLSTQEVRRLHRSVVEIIHDAIKHSGSSLADGNYVDLHGDAGRYAEFHQAYNRAGDACRRCRSVIAKAKFQKETIYFCNSCQV